MNDQLVPGSLEQHRSKAAKQEFLANWESARASGTTGSDLAVCPYPGLRSFRPTEADLFFGRDSQIKELRDLLAKNNIIVVLGGSGSGKSSLVRAGLVPQLNSTSAIPDRLGAWYVVEFRPKLDPVSELFEAIFSRIIKPRLSASSSERAGSVSAGARARRIAALNAMLNLQCEPDATDGTIEWQCRTRLREILFDGDVIDTGALFDFVDERLRALDKALSDDMTSGPPNLLLLVDQFEEVFKPKVDAAGRSMLMSLITSIHTYKPFNLFLIITMRSEELHRCSEFVGITEVVNDSLYLVDLIGGRDIERAIVGPARRLLRTWELDAGDADTGPYTRRALRELHQVFDAAREALPHPADQLPLMQHLLPLVWGQAVERWQSTPAHKRLEIDLEDLRALRGWEEPKGPLIGTLNARADGVLRRAIETGVSKAKGLDEGQVEQLLRAAFCCLAQLDDRGNVVRDFATLDQMLAASGVYERQPDRQKECRGALQAALAVFERATLINVGTNYDVNHEAFIRGWTTYKDWLKEAQHLRERLVNVDRSIRNDHTPEFEFESLSLWRQFAPPSRYVEACARAHGFAGDETSRDLQDVLGPNSTFSEQWALHALERDAVVPPDSSATVQPPALRLRAVRRTVNNALRYPEVRNNQLRWRRFQRVAATFGALMVGLWFLVLHLQSIAQQDLNDQFRFFRLQSEATATPDGRARGPADDRLVYAALTLGLDGAKELAAKSKVDEASAVFRTALRQLDKGTRSLLSNSSALRVVPNKDGANSELSNLETSPVGCAIADPAEPGKDLIASEPGSTGIQVKSQVTDGVRTTAMFPVWRNADGAVASIQSSNLNGEPLPSGALVCLSKDANWLLMWPSRPETAPPVIQRIVWIRLGPMADRDERWHAELQPPRLPGTEQSWSALVSLDRDKVAQDASQAVKLFRSGYRIGFLIDMQDETAMLWTVTGLRDPDPVGPGRLSQSLIECKFHSYRGPDQKGEIRTFRHCEMGSIAFDSLSHTLRAHNEVAEEVPQLASAQSRGDATCNPDGALCQTELRIEYTPQVDGREPLRIALSHLSSTVKAAAIWDDSLWVRDANDQVWRYLVGMDAMRKLLPERWKGVSSVDLAVYSEACKQVQCDTVRIPD